MTISTQLLIGHVLDRLAELPNKSVHCCITSPPYWGLRDYGTEPQFWPDGTRASLGLEPTPELYIQHLVIIFRELRRVLRDDGTFWLNIGDSYASGSGPKPGRNDTERMYASGSGPKPKDLIGIPWMLAFALRDDGWYLRFEIIWAKNAPMPESVTDRPTCAHEKIFLFAKSSRYFYDAEAVKEDAVSTHPSGNGYDKLERLSLGGRGQKEQWNDIGGKRNLRNVWQLNPAGFSGAHFATFPPEIPRRAILAGTSEKGVCSQCGAPWVRVVEKTTGFYGGSGKAGRTSEDVNNAGKWIGQQYGENIKLGPVVSSKTTGWKPTCKCDAEVIPATVIDPFFGSGTTGLVAQ